MMCDDNHARNKQAMDPETGAAKATGTFMPPPTDGGAILSDVARFDRAFDLVLGHEGGYQNRYSDRGNWTSGKVGVGERKGTKWGISAMAYPDHDISRMDVHEAKAIYLRDYWNPVMPQLPPGVAFECFDAQVNTGRGVKFLQMAVGTRADGIWGPASKRALESTITRLGSQHVIKEQVAHRMYLSLIHI